MTWLYSKKKRWYADFLKVPPNKNEGQNPQISKKKRCYAAKLTYLGRCSSDYDKIWHGYAFRPSWPFRTLKSLNFKNPRWRRPPSLKNRKITIYRPQFKRLRRNLAQWCTSIFLTFRPLKILNFKNPTWRRPTSWKIKNRHISATVEVILIKFGIVMQFNPLDRSDRWKIEILKIEAEIWYVNWYA